MQLKNKKHIINKFLSVITKIKILFYSSVNR